MSRLSVKSLRLDLKSVITQVFYIKTLQERWHHPFDIVPQNCTVSLSRRSCRTCRLITEIHYPIVTLCLRIVQLLCRRDLAGYVARLPRCATWLSHYASELYSFSVTEVLQDTSLDRRGMLPDCHIMPQNCTASLLRRSCGRRRSIAEIRYPIVTLCLRIVQLLCCGGLSYVALQCCRFNRASGLITCWI